MEGDAIEAKHPLADVDPWVRYDAHMDERKHLIACKREAEDGYIKTIIQLSSAILLLVPTALASSGTSAISRISAVTIFGFVFISISLIISICEQYFSLIAYKRQIQKTEDYYLMKSGDINPPKIAKAVEMAISCSFLAFIVGTLLISFSLMLQ